MILLIVNLAQPRITCGDCLAQNSLWACLWGVALAMPNSCGKTQPTVDSTTLCLVARNG